jgi:hypothetical protein
MVWAGLIALAIVLLVIVVAFIGAISAIFTLEGGRLLYSRGRCRGTGTAPW